MFERARANLLGEMTYALHDNLSYCIVDGRCYFVDVATNRYFALSPDINRAFLQLREGRTFADALEPGLRRLVHDTSSGVTQLEPYTAVAPREVDFGAPTRPIMLTAMRVVFTYFAVRRVSGALSLAPIARRLKDARLRMPKRHPSRGMAEIAGGVARAKTLLGDHDLCLPWSYVTARLLIDAGYPAQLVFGICPHPFSAHCWVQSEKNIVGDRLERIEIYTPLLAL